MNKKQILQSLAKFYEVKLILKSKWPDHASTDLVSQIIYIEYFKSIPLNSLLSSFFHELSHLRCVQLKKFPLFHTPHLEKIPKSKRTYFLRTIYRAEQYTDREGKKLMKAHFPDLKYVSGYSNSQKKTFFPIMKEQFSQFFKECDKNYSIKKKSVS